MRAHNIDPEAGLADRSNIHTHTVTHAPTHAGTHMRAHTHAGARTRTHDDGRLVAPLVLLSIHLLNNEFMAHASCDTHAFVI